MNKKAMYKLTYGLFVLTAFEDGKAETVWDRHFMIDPDRFFNHVSSNDTLNMYHDYNRFADKSAELGQTSYRTSILWARLLPDGKNVNRNAADYYRNMFKAFKDKGVFLSVVLYWFDMPLLYENRGGFSNRNIIEDYVYYCKICFELFDGDRKSTRLNSSH